MLQTEPGSMWLYLRLFELLRSIINPEIYAPYVFVLTTWQVTSCIIGSVFIFVLLKFTEQYSRDAGLRLVVFVTILCCGGTLFFFGYVEYYVIHYLSVFVYMVVALRTLERRSRLWLPTVLCCVALGLHLMSLCLLPSLVYLYADRFLERRWQRSVTFKHVALIYAVTVVLLVGYYFIGGEYRKNGFFIPFKQYEGLGSYTLLSSAHLIDLGNELLVLSGVGIALLIAALTVWRREVAWSRKEVLFLLLVTGYFFALFVSYSSGFWMRDWDIYGVFGLSLTLLGLYCLRGVMGKPKPREMRNYLEYVLVGSAVVGFVPWVLVNVVGEKAIERYENMVLLNQTTVNAATYDYSYAYEVLRKYYHNRKDDRKEYEVLQRMIVLNGDPGACDKLLMFIKGSPKYRDVFLCALDSLSHAVEESERALTVRTNNLLLTENQRFLYDVYARFLIVGAVAYNLDIQRQGEEFKTAFPLLPHGYELLGFHYVIKRDCKTALEYFGQSYAMDTLRINTLIGLGKTFYRLTRDAQLAQGAQDQELQTYASRALYFYEKALAVQERPWILVIDGDVGYLYLMCGKYANARKYFERYLETDSTSTYAQGIKRELSKLQGSVR